MPGPENTDHFPRAGPRAKSTTYSKPRFLACVNFREKKMGALANNSTMEDNVLSV